MYSKSFYVTIYSLFIFILCSGLNIYAQEIPGDKIVACYWASWSVYRKPFNFSASDIDPFLCTHIIYAYSSLKSDTADAMVSRSPYTDLTENYGLGQYAAVTDLKKINPKLKILISIGGWNEASINFSQLSQSSDKRRSFVASVVEFFKKYNFDGLDVNWQYPAQRGGIIDDKDNFPILLRAIRDEFNKHNYILTVFLSCFRANVEKSYDLPAIAQLVHWINLHCFNINTPWDRKFGISAPLTSPSEYNIETYTQFYLEHGVPGHKLALAVQTHGFGYKDTNNPGKTDGLTGYYSEDKGFLAFHEICMYLKDANSGWKETWDDTTSTPIAVNGANKISYDNQRSITLKVEFAMKNGLGGISVWSMETDDFQGSCSIQTYGDNGKAAQFPIIKTIRQVIGRSSAGITSNVNTNRPTNPPPKMDNTPKLNQTDNIEITIVSEDF